jgi:hypothetical protein
VDVLKNKSYKNNTKISRYNSSPYYYHILDDKYLVGFSNRLKTNTPYIIHNVKRADTFDSLALYYYNNPTYFWIICDFNRINDPFIELKEGDKIKIPSFSTLEFEE